MKGATFMIHQPPTIQPLIAQNVPLVWHHSNSRELLKAKALNDNGNRKGLRQLNGRKSPGLNKVGVLLDGGTITASGKSGHGKPINTSPGDEFSIVAGTWYSINHEEEELRFLHSIITAHSNTPNIFFRRQPTVAKFHLE